MHENEVALERMRAATAKEKRTNGTGLSVYGVGGEGPAAAASMNWMAKVVVMNRWQGAEAPKKRRSAAEQQSYHHHAHLMQFWCSFVAVSVSFCEQLQLWSAPGTATLTPADACSVLLRLSQRPVAPASRQTVWSKGRQGR